ncbi:hypothetical protein [Nonomuraea sp. bgisy101]|uniref:hypothetical protein n=1 Tax=Nonomuraea sp. bgisy101 TaxID=3413784 RepID=UPI003D704E9E
MCCAACAAERSRLTEQQSANIAALIGRAYPGWMIQRSHGTWWAIGRCPDPTCGCVRTLAAPTPGGLIRELRLHLVPGPRRPQRRRVHA